MITLVVGGEVWAPEPLGGADVLVLDGRIAKVGKVDQRAVEALGVEVDVVDASGCLVIPGLIDPHEHLLGGSGEEGFATQTPEIRLGEIVSAGITTVVGALGVDTTMKTMAGLLARVKGLKEEGLNAFVWSGGYTVPPTSILGSVRDDIMFVEEVIGAGEIAVSDPRAMDPDPHELARVVTDAHVGGMLARKAGVTHVHVGPGPRRLEPIRRMLETTDVEPSWLYLTHVERSEALMEEAIALAARGAFVDVDTVEEDLAKWLRFYREHGGEWKQLTASSDAGKSSPRTLFEQVRSCVVEHGFEIGDVLPLVTSNTARALRLREKGTVEAGKIGDLAVLRSETLDLVHVVSRGRSLVRDGIVVAFEAFLNGSNREVHHIGEKART